MRGCLVILGTLLRQGFGAQVGACVRNKGDLVDRIFVGGCGGGGYGVAGWVRGCVVGFAKQRRPRAYKLRGASAFPSRSLGTRTEWVRI